MRAPVSSSNRTVRREPRLKLSIPIVGEWLTETGLVVRVSAVSDNVSYQGVGLLLDASINWRQLELKIGNQVKVSANNRRFSATSTVCYTIQQPDNRWLIGLKLDTPLFGWLSRYQSCSPQLLSNFLPTRKN